eukprot:3134579-Prymnesium_polylepis.1
MGGPPCKFYSTADAAGLSEAPALIGRDVMSELFGDSWALENVHGARKHLGRAGRGAAGLFLWAAG